MVFTQGVVHCLFPSGALPMARRVVAPPHHQMTFHTGWAAHPWRTGLQYWLHFSDVKCYIRPFISCFSEEYPIPSFTTPDVLVTVTRSHLIISLYS